MLNFVATAFAGRPRAIDLRAKVPQVSPDSPKTWVHAAYVGKWEGHPSGAFEFTQEVFRQIIANFDRQANPVPLTYEHPAHSGDGQPIPAAGWVLELKIDGDNLMALVEFTPKAAQMIKDGEYRFSSVVVDFEGIDRESGEASGAELYELAITNTPFLDGQRPIKLSRRVSAGGHRMSEKELISAALDELGDKATMAQVSQWVEGRKMQLAALEGKQEDKAEASDKPAEDVAASDVPAAAVAAEDMPSADPADEEAGAAPAAEATVQMIADAAGLDVAAVLSGLEENLEAVVGLLSGAPADGTEAETEAAKSVANARGVKIAKLEKEIAELKQANVQREIDDAIKCGDVLPADREKLIKLAKDAPHLLADFVKPSAPAIPTTARYHASRPGPAPTKHEPVIDLSQLTEAERYRYDVSVQAGLTKAKAFQLARRNGAESAN